MRLESPEPDQCGGCGARRDPEWHLPHLLAVDTLRLRAGADRVPLGEFARKI